MIGQIIKIISNQYEVHCEGKNYTCIAMGKLRKGNSPVIGDMVELEQFEDVYGIQKIYPRKNELKRPLVANVDQAIIVMSAKDPDFSTTLVDRLIFLISYAGITPVLCITKMDLVEKDDRVYQLIDDYRNSGYDVYEAGNDMDTNALQAMFKDKFSVLTGQSGAGKSSLLNRMSNLQIKTQEISKALGRGKHTTRHSELFPLFGGWIADTPGFSALNFDNVEISKLSKCIPDFIPYYEDCKFKDCIHINEPQCAILKRVEDGSLISYRHYHYKEIVEYIKQVKPKY